MVGARERMVGLENTWWNLRTQVGIREWVVGGQERVVGAQERMVGLENAWRNLRTQGGVQEWVAGL